MRAVVALEDALLGRRSRPWETGFITSILPVIALVLACFQIDAGGQIHTAVTATAIETQLLSAHTESTDTALDSLQRAILSNEAERALLRKQQRNVDHDDQRAEIERKLQSLRADGLDLQAKFESTATGSIATEFERNDDEQLDLPTELTRLVWPILSELKVATGPSREMAALRRSIAVESQRLELARSASSRAALIASSTTNDVMRERLQEIADTWARKAQAKEAEVSALNYELSDRSAKRKSFIALSREALKDFFSTRGRNLTFGVLAFVSVLLLFRFAGRAVGRWAEARSAPTSFGARLVHLLAFVWSILAAFFALLLTLNFTGDWFLLGLVILFLIGAGWGMLKTLPNIYEQLKLILNLGAVRENELIIFDGIHWKVESLGFMAQLVNPLLDGGQVDLPIRELVGHHSRVMGLKEPLFPTKIDDWVMLNGVTHAKVITQTPSVVEVLEIGGARTTISTTDFLALHPVNLSHNYRVKVIFGLDYQHQALCTTEIPAQMREVLEQGLVTEFSAEEIIDVQVKFFQAGSSSLDYELIADIRGSSGSRYRDVYRALSRYAVNACNLYGWVIPFTQVTLHQAVPQIPAPSPLKP
ncbi:MAG: hypothetical protein O3C57_03170 [Verrucomicrobia bacterium]|nr:hypothetical protein [Verrucomicrobiota bacterium]